MALLQTVRLEHLPYSHEIHIALYRDITNASFLQQQLLDGNTNFEYALIDAGVVVSKIHALAAAYRAVSDLLENRLRSRNVHSEIVFSLSPNNNIAESFRRFGITTSTTSLLIIKVSTPSSPASASEVQAHLTSSIEGEQVPFEDSVLAEMTDVPRVKKIYKLNSGGGGGGAKRNGQVNGGIEGLSVNGVGMRNGDERKELENLVLGAMALRGVTN
ncbi:CGI-121-domain-containing protein [Hyaloscypha bicolor E]|uniref:EKC/KEOPS complex subunit CGI121 n=1 Tax=Hyaloscypha bicolor E TaxID=1095630 RepID=A0A2J6TER5_9HELO|nr:CGI-121-domain-containing protein [Hyaloscypha bicolor E]PMD61489.1 CGI-121-domain-containing protein [Hyaloscypha bicolor E]